MYQKCGYLITLSLPSIFFPFSILSFSISPFLFPFMPLIPFFVGAPVQPNMLNMPKSVAAYSWPWEINLKAIAVINMIQADVFVCCVDADSSFDVKVDTDDGDAMEMKTEADGHITENWCDDGPTVALFGVYIT